MKRKQVWRYYCDYCKKSSCSAGHIGRHEKSCTANPNRVCEMHKHCESAQRPIAELIAALKQFEAADGADYKRGLEALREVASHCPACIMAAIRQSGVQNQDDPNWERSEYDPAPYPQRVHVPFEFKQELSSFWATVNDAAAEQSERETYMP